MKAADVLKLLVYDQNLSIPLVAQKLNLHRDTVLKWNQGREPRHLADKHALLQLLEVTPEDAENRLKQINAILEVAGDLNSRNRWRQLLIGLQRRLALTQAELFTKTGLGGNVGNASRWLGLKSSPSLQSKYKILKLLHERKLDMEELLQLGGCVKVGHLYRAIEKSRSLRALDRKLTVSINGRRAINSLAVLPESRNGRELRAFDDGKFWTVFYIEKTSSQPNPLTVPKYIVLDANFLRGLGIYATEGALRRHPKITNSDPSVVRLGIKFFVRLGVPKSRLKAWIQLHERSGSAPAAVKQFWLAETGLAGQQILEVRRKASTGHAEVEKYGVLHVEVQSILVRLLVEAIMDSLSHILSRVPRKDLKYFLQGAFAGDGYVGLTKKGTIHEINFTSKDVTSLNLVAKVLSVCGIRWHKDSKKYQIRVYGYENFVRLANMDIFHCHSARHRRFERGLREMAQKLSMVA